MSDSNNTDNIPVDPCPLRWSCAEVAALCLLSLRANDATIARQAANTLFANFVNGPTLLLLSKTDDAATQFVHNALIQAPTILNVIRQPLYSFIQRIGSHVRGHSCADCLDPNSNNDDPKARLPRLRRQPQTNAAEASRLISIPLEHSQLLTAEDIASGSIHVDAIAEMNIKASTCQPESHLFVRDCGEPTFDVQLDKSRVHNLTVGSYWCRNPSAAECPSDPRPNPFHFPQWSASMGEAFMRQNLPMRFVQNLSFPTIASQWETVREGLSRGETAKLAGVPEYQCQVIEDLFSDLVFAIEQVKQERANLKHEINGVYYHFSLCRLFRRGQLVEFHSLRSTKPLKVFVLPCTIILAIDSQITLVLQDCQEDSEFQCVITDEFSWVPFAFRPFNSSAAEHATRRLSVDRLQQLLASGASPPSPLASTILPNSPSITSSRPVRFIRSPFPSPYECNSAVESPELELSPSPIEEEVKDVLSLMGEECVSRPTKWDGSLVLIDGASLPVMQSALSSLLARETSASCVLSTLDPDKAILIVTALGANSSALAVQPSSLEQSALHLKAVIDALEPSRVYLFGEIAGAVFFSAAQATEAPPKVHSADGNRIWRFASAGMPYKWTSSYFSPFGCP